VIDWALRRIAARLWRRRILKYERARQAKLAAAHRTAEWFTAWKRENPGRCMYCAYTRWVREEQGARLKLDEHDCVEGNSSIQLPAAKVVRS
jgi:hypothetical protein